MIRFFKTTVDGVSEHYHVFGINDQTGQVMFDGASGHEHEVLFGVDENGEPMLQIEPDATDFHVHAGYEELVGGLKKEKKEDEVEAVERLYSLFKTAYEITSDSRKDSDTSENFYIGNQWDEGVKRERESRGDTCLTINCKALIAE